ncbi:MAG: anthrone oxygenase family protein [Ginsengibacter sp.]
MNDVLLAIATTFSALMAGLFFSYSFSVVPGLGKLTDINYLGAMQSINREIQNPVFFICFFGAIIFLPIVTVFNYPGRHLSFWLLLSATVVYYIGVFGVTIFGNVPLNNQLEKFKLLDQTSSVISDFRARFENRWNLLNNIRTASSIISLLLMISTCILRNHESS